MADHTGGGTHALGRGQVVELTIAELGWNHQLLPAPRLVAGMLTQGVQGGAPGPLGLMLL